MAYDVSINSGSLGSGEHKSNSMPPQRIHSTKKTPKWGIRCLMAIKGMSNSVDTQGRSSRENKEENYDLVNSIFQESDFDYVLNPMGIDIGKYGGTPTKMQNYNIIRSRLETLRGEEMNSPLNFFVYAATGDAVSAKKQKRNEMVKELMKASIKVTLNLDEQATALEQQMAELQQVMSTLKDQQQYQEMQQQMQQLQQQRNSMPDIQAEMKKFNSSYVDPTEQTNNKILKYLKRNDQLALKFNQGWFHALVSSEEIYYTGISQGHPTVRVVNPLQIDYDKGANTTFIHEGNWVKEEYWLPIGECIQEYGDVLTDAQVKKIDEGHAGNTYMMGGMEQGFAYSNDGGQRRSSRHNGVSTHAYIMKGCWRSFQKIGTLTYPDPRTGKMETVEVDDTFKMTDELKASGAQISWSWVTEIWEGTQIGSDIFVNIRRKSNQTGNLPYVGYVYNNVNSISTSMVDLVKAHQYTYIITWWRLEQELAKAKGKKFVMDMAQLPKSQGWDVDTWMYYFENVGVAWINSKEEGRQGDPSSVSQFNQFTNIDMSLSQVVGQYMEVLNKIEALVEDIMGVSPQRMGDIKASETATGAQTSIARSTNVTKPWYYFHDLVKEAVLGELLELAKLAYIDGRELELVLDEMEVETLKINGDKLNASQMACFVTNSFEDRVKKEKVDALLTMAVQQGKASLVDVANVINNDSMSYTISALDAAEKSNAEREQAASKAQQEDNAAQREELRKEKELDRSLTKEMNDDNIEKDILLKKMDIGAAPGPQGDSPIDSMRAVSEVSDKEERLALDKEKEENRAAEKNRELDIKEKETKIKQQVANKPTPKPAGK